MRSSSDLRTAMLITFSNGRQSRIFCLFIQSRLEQVLRIKTYKQVAILFFCSCISLSVAASLIGINILSERNHIWGQVGVDEPGYEYSSYDLLSSNPVSYQTSVSNVINNRDRFSSSRAEAGDLSAYAEAAGWSGAGPSAEAKSTYLFTADAWKISLRASGEGESPSPFLESYSIISLIDKTTDQEFLFHKFGGPDDYDYLEGSFYDFDENYLFRVNPTHIYELALYASATSSEDIWNTRLQAELVPAVPVPAAIWLFGTALAGSIGLNRRQRAA